MQPSGRGAGSSSIQRIWKEYFTDPSHCRDIRTTKIYPRSPDFKQELRESSVWEMLSLGEALDSLERMPQPPSFDNFACLFQKCREKRNLAYALRLHAYMCKNGLETHRSLGNYLVPLLVEVGSICDAQQVFDRLVDRNEYSWNSLITGYIECGESQHALTLYQKMQEDCVHPSGYTFVALLKACAKLKDAERGEEIHTKVARKGLERDPFVGSSLVDMYAKCGLLSKAREVFDKLPVRDAVTWNALIAAYVKHGLGEEALNCFEQMQVEGVFPSSVTFVCSLKACGSMGFTDKGQEIHAEIAKKGLLDRDLVVGNALVDMYAKCGFPEKAQEVFNKLPARDYVSWNALIAGYAEHGLGEAALKSFEQMQLEGVSPDSVTFVCSLKACGSIGATDKGQEIHLEILGKGLLERNPFVGSALVDMHAKFGLLAQAQEVFDKLTVQDVVSWNALIAGYAEHGLGEEALKCFEQMQLEGICPDAVTFVCSLKACGSIAATVKGQEIHDEIARKGLLEINPLVGSTLVDMYAKCGSLAKAQEVFDRLPVHDVVSWTALMAGYAHLGESGSVFHMFDRMRGEGIKPNVVTFLNVLTACSHTGLVDKGQVYFEAMSKEYGITPSLEHHTCMIDLLGRAGQFNELVLMLKKMPFRPDLVVWLTVLGACRKWGNVELGRQAFEHAVQLDVKDGAAYVLMANIYADAHMQEDEKKIEAMRVKEQARNKPGQSCWTDAGGIVHSFIWGDTRHAQIKDIYARLEDISFKMEEEGYFPGLHWASRDVSVDAKRDGLCGHSDKLAIACALINAPKGTPIHVVKNLWVCNDCHSATALISKIEQRTIIVRDANRFHVFKEGKCACQDFCDSMQLQQP